MKSCTVPVQIHSVMPVPTHRPIYFITCFTFDTALKWNREVIAIHTSALQLPISLCPPCMPASNTVAACWDQAHEPPGAGTLLLAHPDSVACSLQVHQPGNSLCMHGCSGVQDQMRGSCQESHRSRMHMEMKQDMTNTYSWFRWVHKKQLPLGQPQLIQTVLRRGTAKGIFHVLSHPQGLFFRAQKCFLLSWKPPPAHLQLLNQPYLDSVELGIGKSY